jgi:hypothetical protein
MDTAHFYSRGIPRIMNLLCEQALLKAYSSGIRPVSASMIEDASREFQFDGDRPVAPPLRINEAIASRASVIPIQSIAGNPPMTFAAAAGTALDRPHEMKTVRVPAPPAKAPVMLTDNNPDLHTHLVKAGPAPQSDTFATRGPDVGEIIAELSAGAATPVRVNAAWARRKPNLAALSIRESISSLIRAKAFLLAFIVRNKAELGRRTRHAILSLQSGYRRWANHSVAVASPVIRRMTAPFISWLKQPRPVTPFVRANSETQGRPSTRFSAVSNNLRDRAEPILRWLQTPLRPAHRR